MNINDKYIVDIVDEDNIGNGICKINNIVVFVKNALLGERLEIVISEIKKNYAKAHIKKIINKSDKRIEVICKYYNNCGGCDFMHTTFENESAIKLKYLEKLFKTKINYIENKNYLNYRNKVTLHVKNGKLGYYNNKSHKLCNIDYCYLLDNNINDIIKQLNSTNLSNISEIMIRSVNNKTMINIIGQIKDFNINCDSVYINNNFIKGEKYLIDDVNNLKFSIYPESFYQVNKEGMINIYNNALKHIISSNTLLDLYCGTGTIGIWLNKKFKKILGVEINQSSINNANLNKQLNNLYNIEFICDDAKNIKDKFDTIVVDPPRNGLSDKVIDYLNNSNTKNVIYISCNPNTLKRDIEKLNYNIKKISMFNMFPRTIHCESICILERK